MIKTYISQVQIAFFYSNLQIIQTGLPEYQSALSSLGFNSDSESKIPSTSLPDNAIYLAIQNQKNILQFSKLRADYIVNYSHENKTDYKEIEEEISKKFNVIYQLLYTNGIKLNRLALIVDYFSEVDTDSQFKSKRKLLAGLCFKTEALPADMDQLEDFNYQIAEVKNIDRIPCYINHMIQTSKEAIKNITGQVIRGVVFKRDINNIPQATPLNESTLKTLLSEFGKLTYKENFSFIDKLQDE